MTRLERMRDVVEYFDRHGFEAVQNRYPKITDIDTIKRYRNALKKNGLVLTPTDYAPDKKACDVDLNPRDGIGTITRVSKKVETVDDALKFAQIDLDEWEPYRTKTSHWDVTLKDKNGEPRTETNYQITVYVQRKKTNFIKDGLQLFIEDIKENAPTFEIQKRTKKENPHLVEISIFDHHFGKLCWGKETGTDWDLKIAERSFVEAFVDLLMNAMDFKGDNVERILFPIGQDFFHINDISNKTPMGGNPLDVDERLPKIFKTGLEAVRFCITEAVKYAPVDIIYSPGNHDMSTTYFMCEALNGYFNKCPDVTIDISPEIRKAYEYGKNFIGLVHHLRQDVKSLPTIFSTHPEYSKMWANAEYREIQTGHFHKKEEIVFNPLQSTNGVVVRRMPSLTGTDFWHYQHNFVGNVRMAECYLFDKYKGPAGYFPSLAK